MSEREDLRTSELDGALDRAAASEDLAADLFAVVDALEGSPTLRRAVTDPGTSEDARRSLVHSLLDGKVSPDAVNVVAAGAALRWAGGRTFAEALERQGVRAQLISADASGQLEETEDAMFRFARLVESSPDLRSTLADRSVPLANRQQLLADLLQGKASAGTIRLISRAVGARERTFAHTIESYINLAAQQKNRVIATVRVARPITVEQASRLQAALSRQAGREVALQIVVDERVIGGVQVELGDEVIEGTVGTRLEEAKRTFS